MINISIESFKLLLNEINQIENKNSFIVIPEDALLSKVLFPALLPFGRSCYCSALCSLFLFFSQIFLRFLLQQISTVLKQHIFWKKRTFCLPLPAVYIPETDKYSCLTFKQMRENAYLLHELPQTSTKDCGS